MIKPYLVILLSFCFTSVFLIQSTAENHTPAKDWQNWSDPSQHKNLFLELDGYRLNYLDWGGTGKNMIFVPGLGDSPHIFDDLAPKFTDQYRVIAYARRGHGQSTTPPNAKFDMDTLAEDLRLVMDSLNMESATFVGFSMGGVEINRFTFLHPERVDKLIYLDAAYDYTGPEFQAFLDNIPVGITSNASDFASPDALYNWLRDKGWRIGIPDSDALRADVIASSEPSPCGGVRLIVEGALKELLFDSLFDYHFNFSSIEAPSLAIYGINTADFFTPKASGPDVRKKVETWIEQYNNPWQWDSIKKFQSEAPNGRVGVLPETHHAIFLHRPERILEEMNAFLNEE
jgi:pimeloyl-ACP methyl ester carboxylesterase